MPRYQYTCTACGQDLEVVQSFTDEPLVECPACGGRLRKVFTPVGVVFKGSGFYRTDARAGASGAKAPASADSSAAERSSSDTSRAGAGTTHEGAGTSAGANAAPSPSGPSGGSTSGGSTAAA